MIFVVAGPMTSRFDRFIRNSAVIGASTLVRLSGSKNPARPDGMGRRCERSPGYVRASTTGRAVWMEK